MAYRDSFVYSLRQKVGDMRLITATVNVIPIREDGRIKCVYVNQFNYWTGVGGHVELGDSWQSAALNELREEAGITAEIADLEIFATFSGPGRVYEYADGMTQPFTLGFICRHWDAEAEPEDGEEIAKTAWLAFDEARAQSKDKRFNTLLDACEKYLETGKVQTIIEY